MRHFARKFLVVVDKTPECKVALRFATRRAQHTGGRVSLICFVEQADYQQWRGVEEIMRAEAREDAEAAIYEAARLVHELTGIFPELLIEDGEPAASLGDVIARDADISILVLAAATAKDGPGPLVSMIAGPQAGAYPIPVTIVPGRLSDGEIDALA